MINGNNQFYQNAMINNRKDNDEWNTAVHLQLLRRLKLK